MSGFEKQTYTQVPNSLFAIMKDMDECELKVVLHICRETFGYHREEKQISTRKIADAIGMSTASVDKGADAAVARGLIERITDGQKTTTWRALVSVSNIDTPLYQNVKQGASIFDTLLGVKERKESNKDNGDESPHQTNELPLEWQILTGEQIIELPDQDDARRKDAANLIATGMGGKSREAYALCYEFMTARKIVIPHGNLKGQRRPLKAMLESKVKPEHIRRAVQDLTEKQMTITDLFSVSKTAIDLANPSEPKREPERKHGFPSFKDGRVVTE